MLTQIFSHTPLWVYGLLAGLVGLGWQQSRNRHVQKILAFVVPVVMVVLSFIGVYSSFGWQRITLSIWLAALVGVAVMGDRYFPLKGVYYQTVERRFYVPGSWLPLAVILLIFFAKYAVGVMAGLHDPLLDNQFFIGGLSFLYGGLSGFFVARAWGFSRALSDARP